MVHEDSVNFPNDDFSSLLRVPGDPELPFLEYSSYGVPLDAAVDVSLVSEDSQAADNQHCDRRSKRAKIYSAEPHNTFIIRAPTLRAKLLRLPPILDQLKDVALPTKSKFGYIATLFGGVLHLSYPLWPTNSSSTRTLS